MQKIIAIHNGVVEHVRVATEGAATGTAGGDNVNPHEQATKLQEGVKKVDKTHCPKCPGWGRSGFLFSL